jgi:hypothetical protein
MTIPRQFLCDSHLPFSLEIFSPLPAVPPKKLYFVGFSKLFRWIESRLGRIEYSQKGTLGQGNLEIKYFLGVRNTLDYGVGSYKD